MLIAEELILVALDPVKGTVPLGARTYLKAGGSLSAPRAEGHSWATISAMPGTSGEAARQRYGRLATA